MTENNGWMPISTAPRDHHPVLTWSLDQGMAVAFLDATWSWWSIPNGDDKMRHQPTHWYPLPVHPLYVPAEGGETR
jgi:hypothetical protein